MSVTNWFAYGEKTVLQRQGYVQSFQIFNLLYFMILIKDINPTIQLTSELQRLAKECSWASTIHSESAPKCPFSCCETQHAILDFTTPYHSLSNFLAKERAEVGYVNLWLYSKTNIPLRCLNCSQKLLFLENIWFFKYLLRIYYMPSTILGTVDSTVNMNKQIQPIFQRKKTDIKK